MSASTVMLLQQILSRISLQPGDTIVPSADGWRKLSEIDHANIDRWYANSAATINAIASGIGSKAAECKPCGATIEAHEKECSYCKTPRESKWS